MKKVLITCLLLAVFLTACNNKKTIQSTEKKQTQSTEQVAESKISWNQSPADIKKMKAKLKKYLKENKIKFESINYEKNSYDKYGIKRKNIFLMMCAIFLFLFPKIRKRLILPQLYL